MNIDNFGYLSLGNLAKNNLGGYFTRAGCHSRCFTR